MAQRPLSIVVGLSAMLLVAGTAFAQTQTGGDMMMEPCMQASEMMMEPTMESENMTMDPAKGPGDDMMMAPEG